MNQSTSSPESDIYYAAIRKALAQGNAAVMVGAGFSRNAEGGMQLSTWPQLARELALALDPNANKESFSTANVTQLAEQYARVFSTPALEDLLKRKVPDDRVAPGSLHNALMSLPWSEIFTTNYDTLLERTAEKMFERAHFTVCCREDIPQSKVLGRRRIVKLHGSFPSQRPFIFTEEDYRTYPQKFAPFVNLVRQSLLENVLCLIGFSGDDPNFLHWLGWVRDMLDKHALPVYLFLSSPTTLGQRRLLEARGVTAVMLPPAPSEDSNDYSGRYKELFRQLAEPIEQRQIDWGRAKWPNEAFSYSDDESVKYQLFLQHFPNLTSLRQSYPGWMVAPRRVRKRFEISARGLPYTVELKWIQAKLKGDSAPVALAIVSLYAWHQDILLAPLDDEVARLAIHLVKQTAESTFDNVSASVRDRLKAYQVEDNSALTQCWMTLAYAVARWARQALLDDVFRDLCGLMTVRCPNDGRLVDTIRYEEILLLLHRGERMEARAALKKWCIQSADAYVLVRKAALTAELINGEVALAQCKEAIQRLRESQKLRPADTLLMSQEAWACLIAERLQHGLQYVSRVFGSSANDELRIAGLGERLETLAARGYHAQRELDEVICALQAEAPPPFSAKYKFGGFDLGASSVIERFGITSELSEKIQASFEWLELAERVGLLVRSANVTFFADFYVQAAWWAKYADSTTRVLSVLIRSVATDFLKPKDDSKPPHQTGWLSRYQVATLPASLAADLCERFLREVAATLSAGLPAQEVEATVAFYVEIFSRLVLRVVDPDLVMRWGLHVVEMHKSPTVQMNQKLWRPFAGALARVMETLPATSQPELLREIASLPHSPIVTTHEFHARDWIRPFDLLHHFESVEGSLNHPDWRDHVDKALHSLERYDIPPASAWHRIVFLEHAGVLTPEDKLRVARVLWRGESPWPVMPGFLPRFIFLWPTMDGTNVDERYLAWLLSTHLSHFSLAGSMVVVPRSGLRSWGLPVDDSYLSAWSFALTRSAWSVQQFQVLLAEIGLWWKNDGENLKSEAPMIPTLQQALDARLEAIDLLLSEGLRQAQRRTAPDSDAIVQGVLELREILLSTGVSLRRVDMLHAIYSQDTSALPRLQDDLTRALFGNNEADIKSAALTARLLLEHSTKETSSSLGNLVDALVSIVLARRMPSLIWALVLLSDCAAMTSSPLQPRHLRACETALGLLFEELRYQHRPEGSDIADDAVPLLRFYCARFAVSIGMLEGVDAPNARMWVESVSADPLPEMRLGRFRHVSS